MRLRSLASLAAPRLAVGMLLLLCAAGVAAPAAADVLVSNLQQVAGGDGFLSDFDQAQAFTTGSNSDGYTLTSVELNMAWRVTSDALFTVSIHSDNSGAPGASFGTLTHPSPLVDNAVNAFTHTGIALDATTTYFVVIDATGATGWQVGNTSSDNEDLTSATGWSIADGSLSRTWTSSGSWTSRGASKKIRVNGTAKAGTPATGKPSITGAAQAGMTLTAGPGDIDDADGLSTPGYTYQWLRNGSNITNATNSTYTLTSVDYGQKLRVRAMFTDDASNAEQRTSDETLPVAPAATACPTDAATVWCARLTVGHALEEEDGDHRTWYRGGIRGPLRPDGLRQRERRHLQASRNRLHGDGAVSAAVTR